MRPSPPLRFLVLVLGGWVCVRAALLGEGWWVGEEPLAPRIAARPVQSAQAAETPSAIPSLAGVEAVVATEPSAAAHKEQTFSKAALMGEQPLLPISPVEAMPVLAGRSPLPKGGVPPALVPAEAEQGRWSGSAWLFLREGVGRALAPGGTLGGSQGGARILYRLNENASRPLSLSARVYAPTNDFEAAEAAVGVDWAPVEAVPLHVLVERREALGEEGRSSFSLTFYGGVSEAAVGPLRLDAYAQAGVVGMRSRDLFADGTAKLGLPVGKVKVGAGLWGAAQPGVERLEAGPQASLRLPVEGANLVLAVDWRLRVAGDAEPGSGPTLTLAADF